MSVIGLTRPEVRGLLSQLRTGRETGGDAAALALYHQHIDYHDISSLLTSDYSDEYIAEFLELWRPVWPILSRSELLRLVERIMNAEGTEAQGSVNVLQFKANCKHPAGTDLIFYPDTVFPPGRESPSLEEIVDAALTGQINSG